MKKVRFVVNSRNDIGRKSAISTLQSRPWSIRPRQVISASDLGPNLGELGHIVGDISPLFLASFNIGIGYFVHRHFSRSVIYGLTSMNLA